MSLYRRAAKRDDAEPEVVEALTQLGASVVRLSGRDVPDLLIGWRGITLAAEVKTGKAKLKPGQASFQARWSGSPVAVLRNATDATRWLLGFMPQARQVAAAARRLEAELEALEIDP